MEKEARRWNSNVVQVEMVACGQPYSIREVRVGCIIVEKNSRSDVLLKIARRGKALRENIAERTIDKAGQLNE